MSSGPSMRPSGQILGVSRHFRGGGTTAGTVGHTKPCPQAPESTAGEAQARVHGRTQTGLGGGADHRGAGGGGGGGGGGTRSSLGSSASPSRSPWVSLLSPGDTGQQAEGVCSCSHPTGHLQTAHAQRQGMCQASSG